MAIDPGRDTRGEDCLPTRKAQAFQRPVRAATAGRPRRSTEPSLVYASCCFVAPSSASMALVDTFRRRALQGVEMGLARRSRR
jgi:hypothetical protein